MPQKDSAAPVQSKEMTPEDLYNFLMQEIEPELTTQMIPELELLYEDEAPEEAKQRREHYEWCFTQLGKMWKDYVKDCQSMLKEIQSKALAEFQKSSSEEEQKKLEDLSKEIDSA